MAEINEALLEKLCKLEEEYAMRYSRGATLFPNPTNGFADDVMLSVSKLYSKGPYCSAADGYKL